MRLITAFLALFLVSSVFAESGGMGVQKQKVSGVSVESPWVRAVPPVSKNTAGYLKLKNSSHQELVIVGASSKRARVVELHTVKKSDGMMSMTPVSQVVIPPYGEVEFKPGSYHLMLIDLAKPVKEGESVDVDLIFKGGKKLKVQLPVKQGAGMSEHHHHHH